MTGLTTHVLDTALGKPAVGMRIDVVRHEGKGRAVIKTVTTNEDGRVDGGPILNGDSFIAGEYELIFHAGDYLRATGHSMPEPLFLDIVPIRFGVADTTAHYHVPLLISPFSYSTYRGS